VTQPVDQDEQYDGDEEECLADLDDVIGYQLEEIYVKL
jgi:hypothetical protein